MNYQKKEDRPIDETVRGIHSWWKRSFVFIKKTEIKTWQGVFVLAFIVGILSSLVLLTEVGVHVVSRAEGEAATLFLSPATMNVEKG